MSLSNESRIQTERYKSPFLKNFSDLFWDIPGERHRFFHPALFIYILILAWYLYLILGPYQSRLSPSDFLNYVKLASTDDPITFGRAICERLSILLPIRLLVVVFKLSPAAAGKIVTIAVELLLLSTAMLFCHRLGGVIAGVLAGCLLSCSTFMMLITDIRADHFAALFLSISLLLASESHGRGPPIKKVLIFLVGVALTLLSGSKPNFVLFIPLFVLPFVIKRQWKQLFVLCSGILAGVVFIGTLFIVLYPKEIWASYFKLLSISFSVYNTPHKATYSVQWFSLFLNQKFYVLPLFIIPLFRKSYSTHGIRECFVSSLFYLSSLMIFSALNARMMISDVYMLITVMLLVMGSALVIAKRANFNTLEWRKLLFLGFAVAGMFVLGGHIGLNQTADIVNQSARIPALIYMFTPLLGIVFATLLVAFNGGRMVWILMVTVLAIPQTIIINAFSHQRFLTEVRKFNNQFYSFTDRIPTRYLEKEPVLISLKEAPLSDKFYERYTPAYRYAMILGSRRYPIPKVGIFINQRNDVEGVLKNRYYKSVITDDPGMIMEMCQVSFVRQIVNPDSKIDMMPPLYYLDLTELPTRLPHDYESRSFNWRGPDAIDMKDLARVAAPLMISGSRGNFVFKRIPLNDENVIRVEPLSKEKKWDEPEMEIQFGYWQGRNGFDISFQPNQEIVFSLFARLSDENSKSAKVFVQDKVENWQRSSFIVQGTEWKRYVVSKRIRAGTKDLNLGISWQPNKEEDWLEIKNVKIFVENIDSHGELISKQKK